jgi:hypothetical protein
MSEPSILTDQCNEESTIAKCAFTQLAITVVADEWTTLCHLCFYLPQLQVYSKYRTIEINTFVVDGDLCAVQLSSQDNASAHILTCTRSERLW